MQRFWESKEGQEMQARAGQGTIALCLLPVTLPLRSGHTADCTHTGHALQARIDAPFDKATSHPASLVKTRYALTPLQVCLPLTTHALHKP